MTVFVDNARNPYGRMIMCHMVGDSIDDLFSMVDQIGIARGHFQNGSFPHFDLSLGYRKRAISAGAIEVDRRGLVKVMREYRQRLQGDLEEKERLMQMIRRYG